MPIKEVLFVLLSEYADWEAASLAAAINEDPAIESGDKDAVRKYQVKTVSLTMEPVESIGGFKVIPDYDIDSVPDDFAGVILIGGTSWREPAARKVMSLVQKAQERGIFIGGICDGSVFLGMNGMLNDVDHTSNELEDLKQAAGKNYTGEARYICRQAVRDGNIVTANGSAFLEFAREILLYLDGVPAKEIEEWYDFFKYGYYEAMKKRDEKA